MLITPWKGSCSPTHVSRVTLNSSAAKKGRLEYVKPYREGSEIYRYRNPNFSSLAKKKKKLYGPFLWMEFNCLQTRTTFSRQFTARSFPVVLSTGPLDWESSALTIRPLLLKPRWPTLLKTLGNLPKKT